VVESQPSKLLVAGSIPVSRSIFRLLRGGAGFSLPIRAKLGLNAQGLAHHCAIGIGHIASKIEKLGALLNIETVRIC
jgi:L-arabinose isomerase